MILRLDLVGSLCGWPIVWKTCFDEKFQPLRFRAGQCVFTLICVGLYQSRKEKLSRPESLIAKSSWTVFACHLYLYFFAGETLLFLLLWKKDDNVKRRCCFLSFNETKKAFSSCNAEWVFGSLESRLH